jgi:hypothetical protein
MIAGLVFEKTSKIEQGESGKPRLRKLRRAAASRAKARL